MIIVNYQLGAEKIGLIEKVVEKFNMKLDKDIETIVLSLLKQGSVSSNKFQSSKQVDQVNLHILLKNELASAIEETELKDEKEKTVVKVETNLVEDESFDSNEDEEELQGKNLVAKTKKVFSKFKEVGAFKHVSDNILEKHDGSYKSGISREKHKATVQEEKGSFKLGKARNELKANLQFNYRYPARRCTELTSKDSLIKKIENELNDKKSFLNNSKSKDVSMKVATNGKHEKQSNIFFNNRNI